jgi:hypothetical protein
MVGAVNDVLQLTVVQLAGENPTLNVFHYRILDPGAVGTTYAEVAEAFWDYISTQFRALIGTGFDNWFDRVDVLNVTDEIGFGTYTISGAERAGTRATTGDWMGRWIAFPLRLNVGTRLTRPGQKRFGSVFEGDQSGGTIGATALGIIQTLGDRLDDNIGFGLLLDGEMQPVVYGLSTGEGVPVRVNPIVSTTAVAEMTSQRTRKR